MALSRRATDLFVAGDRDEAWGLWSDDCVGIPPTDWPEPGPFRGREQNRDVFNSWNVAFGPDWTSHLEVREMSDLGDGRVLVEFEFRASGVESGLPIDQELAVIYTISEGQIVKGEYFMDWAEAKRAAGVE